MTDTNDNIANANANGRPATPRETAATAYATHLRNVSAMLDWLGCELEAHAERQKGDPGNWGRAGDLAELERLVKRALGHVSGMDDARIDQALADLDT